MWVSFGGGVRLAFLIPSPFIVWLQSVVESMMVEAGAKLDNLSHEFIYIFPQKSQAETRKKQK